MTSPARRAIWETCPLVRAREGWGRLVGVAKSDPAPVELAFGCFTFLWGLPLLFPNSHGLDAPTWDLIRPHGGLVGCVAVSVALFRFSGIALGFVPLRLVASFGGFLFWLTITSLCALYDPSGTGVRAYGFYTALNAALFLRNLYLWRRGRGDG